MAAAAIAYFKRAGRERSKKRRNVAAVKTRKKRETYLYGGEKTEASKEKDLWLVTFRGFLPSRDPVTTLPAKFQILLELMERLPQMTVTNTVRAELSRRKDALIDLPNHFNLLTHEGSKQRVHGIYSYLAAAFLEEDGMPSRKADGVSKLPASLSIGYHRISIMIDRKPSLDYCDTVLYNWERIDRQGPIVPSNIRLLNRFTGMVDEEWFFKVHVVIESEATPVLTALVRGIKAAERNDMQEMMRALETMERRMWVIARICLPLMFKRGRSSGISSSSSSAPLCDYWMFYNRLRKYIGRFTKVEYEGVAEQNGKLFNYPGPSGAMSTLLPALDAFLGVEMSDPKLGNMIRNFEKHMPAAHRAFLNETVRESKVKPREAILRFCKSPEKSRSVKAALVQRFNELICRVADFRWRHLHFVRKYIIEQSLEGSRATGTGGSHALAYLRQHIHDTEQAKLPSDGLLSDLPAVSRKHASESWSKCCSMHAGFLCCADEASSRAASVSSGFPDETPRKLLDLCARVPTYAVKGSGTKLRAMINDAMRRWGDSLDSDTFQQALWKHTNSMIVELVRIMLAFLCVVYERSHEEDEAGCGVPIKLKSALDDIARKTSRPNYLCFNDMVRLNWTLREESSSSPTAVSGTAGNLGASLVSADSAEHPQYISTRDSSSRAYSFGRFNPRRIGLLLRFTATEDEDLFWKQCIATDAAAGGLVHAFEEWRDVMLLLEEGVAGPDHASPPDDLAVDHAAVSALRLCRRALGMLGDSHLFASNNRADKVLMCRLRTFIEDPVCDEAEDGDVTLACKLYVGGSAILPSIYRFLGVSRGEKERQAMQSARDTAMRELPKEYREWLVANLRCETARDYVLRRCEDASVSRATRSLLKTQYNACIESLQQFCSRRSRLVCRYLPQIKVQFVENIEAREQRAIELARLG